VRDPPPAGLFSISSVTVPRKPHVSADSPRAIGLTIILFIYFYATFGEPGIRLSPARRWSRSIEPQREAARESPAPPPEGGKRGGKRREGELNGSGNNVIVDSDRVPSR